MRANQTITKNTNSPTKEIKSKNPNIKNTKFIFDIYEEIKTYFTTNMRLMNEEIMKREIKELKINILSNPNDINNYIHLISVMIKAIGKIFKYKPLEIQIIIFLFKDKDTGLIEEILTGEGKAIIISFLAILKAFQGKKVDILTSSSVLAEREAKEMKPFYNYFNLLVDYCDILEKLLEIHILKK